MLEKYTRAEIDERSAEGNKRGREFERCLLSFFKTFYSKVYDEHAFSRVFEVRDKIVDVAFFHKRKILLLQAKTTMGERFRAEKGKVNRRLRDVAAHLKHKFPHHDIKRAVVVVRREGNILERGDGWLYARNTWMLLLRLKDHLIECGYLTEEEFESSRGEFEDLIERYKNYESSLVLEKTPSEDSDVEVWSDVEVESDVDSDADADSESEVESD